MYPVHVKALSVGPRTAALALGLGVLSAAASARAGDVTVFVALSSPTESWNHGFGAALSSTWFNAITFEGEAARIPGETTDAGMSSFTASALLSPPIGALTPYGGIGVGLFRQNVGSESDMGQLKAWIVGAKVKLGGLIVLKAEYRRLELSGTPLLEMDTRLSAGAGIAF
jgi:opacity protein-like surface antigen